MTASGSFKPNVRLMNAALSRIALPMSSVLYWFKRASAMGSPASVSFGQDKNSMHVMIETVTSS